jgi:hypothetical protein
VYDLADYEERWGYVCYLWAMGLADCLGVQYVSSAVHAYYAA